MSTLIHTGEDGTTVTVRAAIFNDAMKILLKARGVNDPKELKPAIIDTHLGSSETGE